MLVRLLMALTAVAFCSIAQAQNCHSTISFSSPCSDAAASYKQATSVCKSTLRVSVGSATAACQSAGAIAANIAGQCASQCVVPPPPPPPQPMYLAPSFRAAAVSHEAVEGNANLVKVTWVYYDKDSYTCAIKRTNKYVAVLDKLNSKNAAYFAANPVPNASKYLSVYMGCPTPTTSVRSLDAAGNPTTSFANGCYVYMSSQSSDPAYCRSLYYIQ